MREAMMISKESLIKKIIECVNLYMGDSRSDQINERTNPITNLGLESIDGVAFACDLSMRLGWEIPPRYNPFIDDKAGATRDIGQMAEFLLKLIRKEAEKP
ncbi:MAG: hypothetical protein NTV15_01165 [Candidatus Bathyarchaeota archaeon]|nr:hypothetical protein [Candidatus Bathyarchaeota archaeon]